MNLINEIKEYNNNSKTNDEKSAKDKLNSTKDSTITDKSDKNILKNFEIKPTKSYQNFYTKLIKNDKTKYQIMAINSIIKDRKKEAEFIIETKNGDLISGGINDDLYIYNLKKKTRKRININQKIIKKLEQTNNQKEGENNPKDQNKKNYEPILTPLNIFEKNQSNENGKLELIICSKIGPMLMEIDLSTDDFSFTLEQMKVGTCSTFFEIDNNSYIIGGEKGIFHTFKQNITSEKNNIKKSYRGGIKIDDNTIAFTSNSILPNGNDELIFYDINSDSINKTIKDYSFTISSNSLALMENGYKILLCGCKKYNNFQNNGILLINEDSKEFIDTLDFEVYCFCPISYNISKEKGKKEIIPTDYFLIGGFSEMNSEGMIKLYKVIKNDSDNKISLEFVQDIIFKEQKLPNSCIIDIIEEEKGKKFNINEKRDKINDYHFNGFERNISCITQSKNNGNLFITCWDGNIYIFDPPNIDYYLELDMEERNKNENKNN